MTNEDQLYQRYGKDCPVGTVLFREGEPGQTMYVIQAGLVRLTKQSRGMVKLVATLGAGEFFGELAIISNLPRSATAEVIEDARLLTIEGRTFESMVRSNSEIAVRLIRKLAERLADADRQIENLLHQDAESRIVHYLVRLVESGGRKTAEGVQLELLPDQIPGLLGVAPWQVEEILGKMNRAKLCQPSGRGLLVPEVPRLREFLDFLEKREKFRGLA